MFWVPKYCDSCKFPSTAVLCSIDLTLDQNRVCFQCILGLVLCSAGAEGHMWALEWGKGLPRLCEYTLFLSLESSPFGLNATFPPPDSTTDSSRAPTWVNFWLEKSRFRINTWLSNDSQTAHTRGAERESARAVSECVRVCSSFSLSHCSPLPAAKHPQQPWLKIQNKVRAPLAPPNEIFAGGRQRGDLRLPRSPRWDVAVCWALF